jgi:hypothetical protein
MTGIRAVPHPNGEHAAGGCDAERQQRHDTR